MKQCTKCGSQCEDNVLFCSGCGNPFEAAPDAAAQPLGSPPPDAAAPPPGSPPPVQPQPCPPVQAPPQTYPPPQAPGYVPAYPPPAAPPSYVPVQPPVPMPPPPPYAPVQTGGPFQQSPGQQPGNQNINQQPAPKSNGSKFVRNYLGFLVMGMIFLSLLMLAVLAGLPNRGFFSAMNMRNILGQFWPLGILALGAVVATRIKGPDLSMGSLMALTSAVFVMTANNGSISAGVIVAFMVCCFYGLLNGTVISLLSIPPAILTLVTAAQMYGITLLILDSRTIGLENRIPPEPIVFIILFAVSLAVALSALIITNRFPREKREKKNGFLPKLKDIFGYALVGIIAGIAGVAMLTRLSAATSSMGSGWDIYIIFIFAAVQSSKLLKNNLIALGYGVAAALILTIFRNAFVMLGLPIMWQRIIEANMALMLLCAACATQGGWRSALSSNLSECEEKSSD